MCYLYIIVFDDIKWEDIQIFDNQFAAEEVLDKIKRKCGNKYSKYNFRIEKFSKHSDRFLPSYDSIVK